jgi:hypothetical protein
MPDTSICVDSICVICQSGGSTVIPVRTATFECECHECTIHDECWQQFIEHSQQQQHPLKCPLCRREAPSDPSASSSYVRSRILELIVTTTMTKLELFCSIVYACLCFSIILSLLVQISYTMRVNYVILIVTYFYEVSTVTIDIYQSKLTHLYFSIRSCRGQVLYELFFIVRIFLRVTATILIMQEGSIETISFLTFGVVLSILLSMVELALVISVCIILFGLSVRRSVLN